MDIIKRPNIEKITFEGLTFGHDNQDAVLSACDFDFPTDRYVWVKSGEGSGKSSLMQLLAGLLIPQSGSYYLNDENVSAMSFEEFLPYRLQIGFSFDYGGLLSNRTVFDNLVLPLVYHKLMPESEARKRVRELMERFEIMKFAKERPASVAGRVRKLAVLLRSLIIQPQIVLLDDPSVGIGEATQEELVQFLKEMRAQGSARHVIITSYDEKFMKSFDHDIIHLDGGLLYHQPADAQRRVSV